MLARVLLLPVLSPVLSVAVAAKPTCEISPGGGPGVPPLAPSLGVTPVVTRWVQGPGSRSALLTVSPFARSDRLWVLRGPCPPPCRRGGEDLGYQPLALIWRLPAGVPGETPYLHVCVCVPVSPPLSLLYDNKAVSPPALALVLCLPHSCSPTCPHRYSTG